MKRILLLAIIALQSYYTQAQCTEWKWPEDPGLREIAEEKNVLYSDYVRSKNWVKAKKPHQWLLTNTPNLQKAIYLNGEKIYKGLADSEKDVARKKVYIDSLMVIYDMRINQCGGEADVSERKAYASYAYNVKKKDELKNILDLFDKAFELNGNKISYYMFLPYMSVITYNAKYLKNLSDEEILERYDNIQEYLDYQIKAEKSADKKDKLLGYKTTIDGLLVGVVKIDCDFVRENLGPKFQENPSDIKMAKKVFGFMLNGKCTDDPLWLQAGETILKTEPDYGIAKALGSKFKAAGQLDKSESYFNQALQLTDDPGAKADMYMQLGALSEKKGQKSSARELFRKAVNADPSKREAYTAIGNLYYGSFNQCAGKQDIVKDRATYMAAYAMFQRAGNSSAMNSAKAQFPSKEEIFTLNYEKGQSLNVGCWIGETVTIDTRD